MSFLGLPSLGGAPFALFYLMRGQIAGKTRNLGPQMGQGGRLLRQIVGLNLAFRLKGLEQNGVITLRCGAHWLCTKASANYLKPSERRHERRHSSKLPRYDCYLRLRKQFPDSQRAA
jgi:hypothetical protein